MNLNIEKWEEFLLGDIFNIKYGVNLELINCEEITNKQDNSAINFVSRTSGNNGVSSKVRRIKDTEPQKAGLITVAGGGSVLSTFLQDEPFYSGRDLYTLEAKENISEYTKIFIVTIIEQNKYKYSYGRQANKTLPFIELKLPIQFDKEGNPKIDYDKKYSKKGYIPDWQFMEDFIKSLHYKKVTTKNKNTVASSLNTDLWKEFKIPNLFDVCAGKYYSSDDYSKGTTPYVSASDTFNGIGNMTDLIPDFKKNKITIGKVGATAYYQSEDFCATSDVNILTPLFDMNQYIGLFIVQVINYSENYKWSYGRQCRIGDTKKIIIKLPIKRDEYGNECIDGKKKYSEQGYIPDWDFMENYIKSLNYGDRLPDLEEKD